jgi:hypothetical protein
MAGKTEHGMMIIATEFKQRAYDGKWERLCKIVDFDSKYSYETETGSRVTLIPEKWITLGVYDYMLEFVD